MGRGIDSKRTHRVAGLEAAIGGRVRPGPTYGTEVRHEHSDHLAVIIVVVALLALAMSARIVKQHEDGVLFQLGRVVLGERAPGFRMIIPFVDVLHRISLRSSFRAGGRPAHAQVGGRIGLAGSDR